MDQPAGTGYSYINTDSYIHELNDVRVDNLATLLLIIDVLSQAADYVVEFLRKFYLIFPEFENMDVRTLASPCLYADSIDRPTWRENRSRDNIYLTRPTRYSKPLKYLRS